MDGIRYARWAAALALGVAAVVASPVTASATGQGTAVQEQEAAARSLSCKSLRNVNPWTYLSVSCTRSSLTDKQIYWAELTCSNGRGGTYIRVGTVYTAPYFGYGPSSRADCYSGDVAVGGRTAGG